MLTSLRGRELFWDVQGEGQGEGPPVLLLHPFPFDGRSWGPVAPLLADRFQVIVPDQRGFGRSQLGPLQQEYSITSLADDAAALLDHLRLPRATVVGLSMGGYVALALAARHPERLASLILADTKAGPDTDQARQGRDRSIELVRAQGVDALLDQQLPRLLGISAGAEVRREARLLGQQHPETVVAALGALRDRPDRRPELPAITCPTLVLVGEDDVLTPPAEAAGMASAIPGARLVTLPGAGHLSHLEAPGRFAAALTAFLQRG